MLDFTVVRYFLVQERHCHRLSYLFGKLSRDFVKVLLELQLCICGLRLEMLPNILPRVRLIIIETVYLYLEIDSNESLFFMELAHLIQCNDEGSLLLQQQFKRFNGLRFEAMHDVDYENGDIAERRAT